MHNTMLLESKYFIALRAYAEILLHGDYSSDDTSKQTMYATELTKSVSQGRVSRASP